MKYKQDYTLMTNCQTDSDKFGNHKEFDNKHEG